MHSNNQRPWLTACILLATTLAPGGYVAAEDNIVLGAQLGGSSLAADTEGPGAAFSNFEHGTTGGGSLVVAYEARYSGQDYRVTGLVGHAKWDNARSLEALAGVDALWMQADGSGGVYAGPRIGAVRFSDNLTDDSNTLFVWGAELGALAKLGSVSDLGDQPVSAGFFLRHMVLDARQSGVTGLGLKRDIKVSSQTSFGFQILLSL